MTTRSRARAADEFGRILPNLDIRGVRSIGIGHMRRDYEIRKRVLLETLRSFEEANPTRKFHKLAESNLRRWRDQAKAKAASSADHASAASAGGGDNSSGGCHVFVVSGDWGIVASDLTSKYGETFAVLNMANAYTPGGGYTEGCPAQEENMFRRTDCHFSLIRGSTIRESTDPFDADMVYVPEMTRLLNTNADGRVYLDVTSPRVCIRGPEDLHRDDLGYPFLPDEEVFPFYELRAAAVDLRGGGGGGRGRFDPDEARRRIAGQLETLVAGKVRHAVLSAFGCGAFRNPAKEVAAIYREEIERRTGAFDVVAFAIFHPGYGPDNFTPFQRAFEGFGGSNATDRAVASGYGTPPR